MITINLGWGRQSFTLAAMVALKELPPVDFAIHADTTHEREETYTFAKRWKPWLEERGVRVVTVKPENPLSDFKDLNGRGTPPFYTSGNTKGVLKRSCTDRWKIQPIRKFLTKELETRGIKKTSGAVTQWLGISLDEVERVKQSDVRYITLEYPLIEKRMTVDDCVKWLKQNGLEVPKKSSCYFCPFHDLKSWRDLSENDFRKAVKIDEDIREARSHKNIDIYVSAKRKPLADIDLRTEEEAGQLSLLDNDECSGHCFI